MEALTPWHLLLILLAVILLFGYKKLPDATRSLGRSLRIFKSEVAAMKDDDPPAPAAPAPAAPAPAELPAPAAGPGPTAEELEAQARAEEARAAELRARLGGSRPA